MVLHVPSVCVVARLGQEAPPTTSYSYQGIAVLEPAARRLRWLHSEQAG